MTRTSASRPSTGAAFTLVELVVVVLILGVLAGVAAPKLIGASQDARAAVILRNVDAIFDAAVMYRASNGQLPGDAAAGAAPKEFEGVLPERLFTEKTSYCSPYDWDGPGGAATRYGVKITLPNNPTGLQLYWAIEEMADDRVPGGGWIHSESGGVVRFYLGQ